MLVLPVTMLTWSSSVASPIPTGNDEPTCTSGVRLIMMDVLEQVNLIVSPLDRQQHLSLLGGSTIAVLPSRCTQVYDVGEVVNSSCTFSSPLKLSKLASW